MKKTIALLFGGKGEEHAVSCRSAAAVYKNLCPERYRVLPIGIDRQGDFFFYRGDCAGLGEADFRKQSELLLPTFPMRLGSHSGFYSAEGLIPVELALPILHGRGGEDGEIQGLLSAAGIPFVGCDCVTSGVCFDKEYTKRVAEAAGVPTVRGVSLPQSEDAADAAARVYETFSGAESIFIKPARQGSSIGASVVKCKEEFAKCRDLACVYGKALAEEYIEEKRELEVALLQRDGKFLFAGPGEIVSRAPLYSYREKYESGTAEVRVRADIPEQTKRLLFGYCEALASALSLRGLSRLDFFLTPGGALYFNEVNTLPGFTEASLYPALWEAEGLAFPALLDILIGEAIARPA